MKKNFDQLLLNAYGEPEKSLTMRKAIIDVLVFPSEAEHLVPVDEKLKRDALRMKLVQGGEQDFTVDELAMIKDRIGKYAFIQIISQVYGYIEK